MGTLLEYPERRKSWNVSADLGGMGGEIAIDDKRGGGGASR